MDGDAGCVSLVVHQRGEHKEKLGGGMMTVLPITPPLTVPTGLRNGNPGIVPPWLLKAQPALYVPGQKPWPPGTIHIM
jgi:hypothetical protein